MSQNNTLLPEVLRGEWDVARLSKLVQTFSRGEGALEWKALLELLKSLQKAPVERIDKLELMPSSGGVIITFADGSGVTLTGTAFTDFLTKYIRAREHYITMMEFNRKGDPRITGELTRILEELRLTKEELETYKRDHPPLL